MDEVFGLEATWRGAVLTWRLSGQLGRRAALILAELGPVLFFRVPSKLHLRLDGVTGFESGGVAVLGQLLAELARRGNDVRVEGGPLPLRRLLQPPPMEVEGLRHYPATRWTRGHVRS